MSEKILVCVEAKILLSENSTFEKDIFVQFL